MQAWISSSLTHLNYTGSLRVTASQWLYSTVGMKSAPKDRQDSLTGDRANHGVQQKRQVTIDLHRHVDGGSTTQMTAGNLQRFAWVPQCSAR